MLAQSLALQWVVAGSDVGRGERVDLEVLGKNLEKVTGQDLDRQDEVLLREERELFELLRDQALDFLEERERLVLGLRVEDHDLDGAGGRVLLQHVTEQVDEPDGIDRRHADDQTRQVLGQVLLASQGSHAQAKVGELDHASLDLTETVERHDQQNGQEELSSEIPALRGGGEQHPFGDEQEASADHRRPRDLPIAPFEGPGAQVGRAFHLGRMMQAGQDDPGAVGNHDAQEGHAVDFAEVRDVAGEDGQHHEADDHEGNGDIGVALQVGILVDPALQDGDGQVPLLAHRGHEARGTGKGGIHGGEKGKRGRHHENDQPRFSSLMQGEPGEDVVLEGLDLLLGHEHQGEGRGQRGGDADQQDDAEVDLLDRAGDGLLQLLDNLSGRFEAGNAKEGRREAQEQGVGAQAAEAGPESGPVRALGEGEIQAPGIHDEQQREDRGRDDEDEAGGFSQAPEVEDGEPDDGNGRHEADQPDRPGHPPKGLPKGGDVVGPGQGAHDRRRQVRENRQRADGQSRLAADRGEDHGVGAAVDRVDRAAFLVGRLEEPHADDDHEHEEGGGEADMGKEDSGAVEDRGPDVRANQAGSEPPGQRGMRGNLCGGSRCFSHGLADERAFEQLLVSFQGEREELVSGL
ncbi:hypothetical protein D3C87_1064610 [compost metagenome]